MPRADADQHRPAPRLAQKLKAVEAKAKARAHEEEKRRKGDEKRVVHVNNMKRSRGEVVGKLSPSLHWGYVELILNQTRLVTLTS